MDLDRTWHAVLRGAAVAVAETLGDVTDPGGGNAPHAAGADQLIEQRIRYRPDQLEVPATLADHLVARRERDQRLERDSDGDGRTVGHESFDGLRHRHDLGYCAIDSM